MEKVKKSRLSGIPAWAWSLMTFFATIGIFELLELLPSIPDPIDGFDYELIMVVIIYAIFLTTACFFICRTYPKSIWYTPIICNALIIFIAIMDERKWTTSSEWISLVSIIAISVIGAIVGARKGRNITKQST
ncbi:MAG: hypothetical protein C0591_05995 [Marinilabiliales bacterium]|nr:MAG: hypothetical protein C0591_05995 [Marinilabiliales bacterium]